MIRTLVVDDHTMVRAGLCRLLDSEPDIQVLAQAGSGREAVQRCRESKPDVVVLDYGLPDIDGLETTRQIVALGLGVRVLILTMYDSEEYATRVIRAGATGFVLKVAPPEELMAAVRKVAQKGVYVTPTIMDKMVGRMGQNVDDAPEVVLSDRELQVLIQLGRGSTSREVSKSLSLSISTVETYRARILEKLNLRNNSDMTRFAIRRGLIDTH